MTDPADMAIVEPDEKTVVGRDRFEQPTGRWAQLVHERTILDRQRGCMGIAAGVLAVAFVGAGATVVMLGWGLGDKGLEWVLPRALVVASVTVFSVLLLRFAERMFIPADKLAEIELERARSTSVFRRKDGRAELAAILGVLAEVADSKTPQEMIARTLGEASKVIDPEEK